MQALMSEVEVVRSVSAKLCSATIFIPTWKEAFKEVLFILVLRVLCISARFLFYVLNYLKIEVRRQFI